MGILFTLYLVMQKTQLYELFIKIIQILKGSQSI